MQQYDPLDGNSKILKVLEGIHLDFHIVVILYPLAHGMGDQIFGLYLLLVLFLMEMEVELVQVILTTFVAYKLLRFPFA